MGARAPFLSLDETKEQHIGHYESACNNVFKKFNNGMRKVIKHVFQIEDFIIYKVMKYRKILIKYNAYFKKAVFHSRENIKSCIFTAVKI